MPRATITGLPQGPISGEVRIIPPNPATFTSRILDVIRGDLTAFLPNEVGTSKILDPFAGPGGIHALRPEFETYGVEIEREWAMAHRDTFIGDSRRLASLPTITRRMPFDAVVTSPTYGNRMADHHEARDPCRNCEGFGGYTVVDGDWLPARQGEPGWRACRDCLGSGLTRRHTYRHQLGRPLTDGNAGAMQWGDDYRNLHRLVWVQCFDVLRDGGLLILNVKDHVRDGHLQGVPGWHVRTIQSLGFTVENITARATGGMLHGANRELRADAELVITFRKEGAET